MAAFKELYKNLSLQDSFTWLEKFSPRRQKWVYKSLIEKNLMEVSPMKTLKLLTVSVLAVLAIACDKGGGGGGGAAAVPARIGSM